MTPLAFLIGFAAGCLACWMYSEHRKQSRARQISAWVRQDRERERMAREEQRARVRAERELLDVIAPHPKWVLRVQDRGWN